MQLKKKNDFKPIKFYTTQKKTNKIYSLKKNKKINY